MKKAVCYTDIHYPVGNVDDKMFSSFTEHLGEGVFTAESMNRAIRWRMRTASART